MLKLEPPDSHHLLAASGWIDLLNYDEANLELEKIQPLLRVHPDVLKFRWQIYAFALKWEAAVDIGLALRDTAPDHSEGWINAAYALHELKRTQEAFDTLLPAAKLFPECKTIPYNLACYTAQLGELEQSKIWLQKAIALGDSKETKLMALDDPDLEPLWKEICNL